MIFFFFLERGLGRLFVDKLFLLTYRMIKKYINQVLLLQKYRLVAFSGTDYDKFNFEIL